MPIYLSDLSSGSGSSGSSSSNRKHLKRHTKPFACTYDNCQKVFGAKNDWKRHENSQHHQLELWKCDMPSKEPGRTVWKICGKCHHRKADFVRHLRLTHPEGLIDEKSERNLFQTNTSCVASSSGDASARSPSSSAAAQGTLRRLAKVLEDCHIPKNHAGQFWCGFCRKPVKLSNKGTEGWDERFNHIADHFEKQGENIKNWVKTDEPGAREDVDENMEEEDGLDRDMDMGMDVEDVREGESDEDMGMDTMDTSDTATTRARIFPTTGKNDSCNNRNANDPPLLPIASHSQPSSPMAMTLAMAHHNHHQLHAHNPGRGNPPKPTRWSCCKCDYGPLTSELYVDCPKCTTHHRCDDCKIW